VEYFSVIFIFCLNSQVGVVFLSILDLSGFFFLSRNQSERNSYFAIFCLANPLVIEQRLILPTLLLVLPAHDPLHCWLCCVNSLCYSAMAPTFSTLQLGYLAGALVGK
jgi:hypothetical protein